MSGIYIHIPFCKQACHYCNFHFSTSLKYRKEMVDAICHEILLQKDYLPSHHLDSVYFGGGTPSLLNAKELNQIFDTLHKYFTIATDAEITLEANPDDLTDDKFTVLADSPVNRLSIGVQSFFEEDLVFMNRAHNSQDAKNCILQAQAAGFNNLSVDLIYGSPTTSHEHWAKNVQTLIDLDISHISCYCMTVEPNTALEHFVKKGKAEPVDEEKAAEQFHYLIDQLNQAGYEHYEISNFAKPGAYAKHNASYWKGAPYLGIGPSAHSYNNSSRQWNIANNAQYIKSISEGVVPFEKEDLSLADQYNEYVMTALRTSWGIESERLERWGVDTVQHFKAAVQPFIDSKKIVFQDASYTLSSSGKFLADGIISELFLDED